MLKLNSICDKCGNFECDCRKCKGKYNLCSLDNTAGSNLSNSCNEHAFATTSSCLSPSYLFMEKTTAKYISPWVYTTYRCNLACHYCYVKQKDEDMPGYVMDIMLSRFNWLLDNGLVKHIVLRVAGGEPLLAFDGWAKRISMFLNRHKSKAHGSLISNLTMLTDEQIEFFNENRFGFGISLDGLCHSKPTKMGTSTAKRVRHNIDRLADGMSNGYDTIDISTVVNSDSIDELSDLAEWIAERNLNWGVYLDHYYDGDFDLTFLAREVCKAINVLYSHGYDVVNKFKFNNVKMTTSYDGCSAGQNLIAVDTRGMVFDCQTAIYDKPNCYIKDYVPRLTPKHELPDRCLDCPIKIYCHGGCKLNNNFGDTCKLTMLVSSHIISTLNL